MTHSKPLAGVRVADFSRLLPGAYCTWLLAALGAEIIKIEQPGTGDYQRDVGLQFGPRGGGVFQLVNQGKKSLGLDLKHASSAPVLRQLIGSSDIIVEGFRPGVAARLGIDFGALRAGRPSLVCISISGFGADSPLRQVAAHDINYLAFSGLLNREVQRGDGIPEVPLVDLLGGGLMPALSALALLLRAKLTGIGGIVDSSLADAVPLLPTEILAAALLGQPERGWQSAEFSGAAPHYGVYPLQDGFVAVGAVEEHFWIEFTRRMNLRNAAGGPTGPNREALKEEIASKFAAMTRDDVRRLFGDADACVSIVNSYGEMLASQHAQARQFTAPPPSPGTMPRLGSPFFHDGHRAFVTGDAPRLGEHSREILLNLGFATSEIAALVETGAVQNDEGR